MKPIPPMHRYYKSIYSIMGFLFIKASRKQETVFVGQQAVEMKRGQLITCRREIAEHTGMSMSAAYKGLKRLEQAGEIEQDTKLGQKYTLITLNDFSIQREC